MSPRLRSQYQLALMVGTATVLLLTAPKLDAQTNTQAETSGNKIATVQLVIDYGDGFQKRYTKLSCSDDTTVWDLMKQAQSHTHPLKVRHRGRGETLLVLAIDGIENGRDADSKSWIYRINGKVGTRSAGAQEAKPGDTILWRFETYR